MRKTWLLTKIQVLSYYGINRLRYGRDGQERRKALRVALLALLAMIIIGAYFVLMVWGLLEMGLGHLAPSLLFMLCSIINFLFFLRSNSILFGFKDYDQIMSLPVSNGQVVGSRLLAVYLGNLPFTLLIMLPGMILYGISVGAGWNFWPMLILSVPLIPLVPMALAMLLGALISLITSRFKHSGLLYTLISMLAIVGLMALSFGLNNQSPEQLAELSNVLTTKVNSAYPLSDLFQVAMVEQSWAAFAVFAGISLAVGAIFVLPLSVFYTRINSLLQKRGASGKYKLADSRKKSVFSALLGREFKRFLNSPVYILNSTVGLFLMLMLCAAAWLFGKEAMAELLTLPGFEQQIGYLAPFLMGFFLTLTVTTSTSLSLEGKTRWILYSLPLAGKTIYNSKLALSLVLQVPCCLLGSLFLALALHPQGLSLLMLFICPLAYALFSSVAGLRMNLAFPRYDWTHERQVVKQSMAVIATMLIGFGVVLAPLILVVLLSEHMALVSIGTVVLLLLGSWLLYANVLRHPLRY